MIEVNTPEITTDQVMQIEKSHLKCLLKTKRQGNTDITNDLPKQGERTENETKVLVERAEWST